MVSINKKLTESLRQIAVLSILGAMLIVVQVALAVIPNLELVSLLVIIYTALLGARALYPIYIFVLVEGLIYGFGLWFINYLYVWAVLFAVTLLCRKVTGVLGWALISGGFGLVFGALCAIPYLFIGGFNAALAYWVSGIPFDIAHCIGNTAAALLLYKPVYSTLQKLTKKYTGG